MKLSVVVVSHNMERELPRTIRSLSPAMQRGIAPDDYEVIVVDNVSTTPVPMDQCRRWIPDLRIEVMATATPSPVPAVNRGLELARGDLIGVMIDGARMASPGLLASALDAASRHRLPVIGAMTYHLGPDLQTKTTSNGYDAATEDALLAESGWEENGYNLFRISTFISLRARGWFDWPAETCSLFLKAEHWRALGGYDPAFVSPGGGLANIDIWGRVCADPQADVVVLLGEATFHQVHGGVTSNVANTTDWWVPFREEYIRIRGKFPPAPPSPAFAGRIGRMAMESVGKSANFPRPRRDD